MWYPASVTVAATGAPVSIDDVKLRLRIDASDDQSDVQLMIAGATDYIEKYCNTRFATQTVAMKCDRFVDFAFLPEAPVQSVSDVTYVDTTGATQTLGTDVYDVRSDGLEASIVLKYGQQWPAVQQGSRITVTAVVGYETAPDAVKNAILLLVGGTYANREPADLPAGARPIPGAIWVAGWSTVDSLLSNYRRGAAYEETQNGGYRNYRSVGYW
ncbi:head-tail connector protein [Bradyrhizobium australafricanum]|uniref:head-tail connector protein n=1 Tax=Bradyrhizobium australafricanum TaxID=2821406 RepID=UPI001CE2A6F0|nr:head-tail connector protein [Bradyrhizobium australafricanum]MCA6098861.1 phage gp6-like head-tail connector protein [Bradyrhizobium australafricanum]